MAGIFTVVEIDGLPCYCPAASLSGFSGNRGSGGKDPVRNGPLIAMDSGFSCILYPEIGFADALDLSAFSTVEETGTALRFTLSRDSVVRGFNRGYGAEFLWQLLDRLSGGRAPDSLKWNLNDWEKRWREVSLLEGTILTLGSDRTYLAETGPLVPVVRQTLSPGVYLLSVTALEAADLLRNAGVDIVAQPRWTAQGAGENRGPSGLTPLNAGQAFPPLGETPAEPVPETADKTPADKTPRKKTKKTEAERTDKAGAIKEKFRTVLADMKITRQEQEELEARIDRRVVVSDTQLKDASVRYEKLEARSLDYVGKTGLVRQAIASGALLEITSLGKDERKILGTPESLDKKGGEMVLTIKPREGGELVKVSLGKISLVRRIKQSIFGV